MTTDRESGRELAPEFPGPLALVVLRLLVPGEHRDEVTGDLIEEAETLILPRHGMAAARSWFWWQVTASAWPLLVRHWTREIVRNPQRWLVAAAIVVMCTLMAIDGGLLTATTPAVVLAALAIAIPAVAGLLSGNIGVYAAAALVSALLLMTARILSPMELRWYAIAFMAFVVLLFDWGYEHRSRPSAPGGSGPAARI
ncbi:MAG: hypothetical protein PVJ49_13250 [Acidobacteriota bacterium]|jgi:hypothetical protein